MRFATYLVYQGGTYKELTKKNSEMKLLLQRAHDAIAATKDEEGWYHVGQYPTKWTSDAQLYEIISQMESAVYDVQLKSRNNGQEGGSDRITMAREQVRIWGNILLIAEVLTLVLLLTGFFTFMSRILILTELSP